MSPAPEPASVSGPSVAAGPDGRVSARSVGAALDDNLPPNVIYKVRPVPENRIVDGQLERWIVGNGSVGDPLLIEFNVCRTADPESDRLFFSMDADADNRLDEAGTHGGTCRQTFAYFADIGETKETEATICVVDLDAAGLPRRTPPECRKYRIFVSGPPRPDTPKASACSLGLNASGWLATMDNNQTLTCTCSLDNTVINYDTTFTQACGGYLPWWNETNCLCQQ